MKRPDFLEQDKTEFPCDGAIAAQRHQSTSLHPRHTVIALSTTLTSSTVRGGGGVCAVRDRGGGGILSLGTRKSHTSEQNSARI